MAELITRAGKGSPITATEHDANLTALVQLHQGSTAPVTIYASMLWADTATSLMKQRSTANSAWITLGSLDTDHAFIGVDPVEKTSDTGSAILPSGTTAQQDAAPVAGYLRWNTTDSSAEVYDGSAWVAVGGGNSTTEGLYEMANTIIADYLITSGNNAISASPITINTGISVTIPTGSTWVIA